VSKDTGVPYKTPHDLGIYLEEETNCPFYFKKFFGLNKLFRVYIKGSSEKSPTITLTAEEADIVKDASRGILLNYKKPVTTVASSLEVLSLQKAATTSNVVPFASRPINLYKYYIHQSHEFQEPLANPVNFDFVVWFNTRHSSFEYPKSIQINDERPHPIFCKELSLYQVSPRAITNYIAPRCQDWIKAGGIQCAEEDFWIDLWSEEALGVYKDPYSDPHPQVQLINTWLKDYEEEKGEKHCAHFTWRD
jgi:hypothetical protein